MKLSIYQSIPILVLMIQLNRFITCQDLNHPKTLLSFFAPDHPNRGKKFIWITPSVWTSWCFIRHELRTHKNSHYAYQYSAHGINNCSTGLHTFYNHKVRINTFVSNRFCRLVFFAEVKFFSSFFTVKLYQGHDT